MNRIEISQIIDDLHRIHRQIGELNYRLQRARRTIVAGETAKKQAAAELVAKQEEKKNLLLIAAQKEKESTQVADELTRRREQLDLAKSEREYASIKIQIELSEKKNNELGDAAFDAISVAEEFDAEIADAKKNLDSANEKLENARAAFLVDEPKWNAEIERAQVRLRETEGKLPREFAGIYVRLLKNFGGEETFAPLTDKVYCGFCNCQAPLELILKVRGGQAACCPSCGRLLYLPEGYEVD